MPVPKPHGGGACTHMRWHAEAVNASNPQPPERLMELELDTLIGLPEDLAREEVEAAGGVFYVVREGVMLADYNARRVKVVVRDGRVAYVLKTLS